MIGNRGLHVILRPHGISDKITCQCFSWLKPGVFFFIATFMCCCAVSLMQRGLWITCCVYLFQFLERCTSLLDLPFAARRLFDESGKEHFSLVNLSRDQLIYVSCGEAWSDPTLSKAEQQRRFLLSNLASDVSQIRHFVNLRHADSMYSKKLFSIFL